jgi:ABC-type transport system substrate-binding protein
MNRKLLAFGTTAALFFAGAVFAETRGENLRVGVSVDAKNFDPCNSVDTYSFSMQKQIYETLFSIDGKTRQLVPVLAESVEMSDDHTYKFHLRKGVKFHNGEEMTAEDVVFSLSRASNPETSVFAKSHAAWIDRDGFEIVDPYTVIVRSKGPTGGVLASLKCPYANILCKKAVEEAGKDYFRKPVGTGPYRLVCWTKGKKVELEAFPKYWGTKPYAKKITFVVLPDDSTRIIALETNKVDLIYAVPAADYERLKEQKDIKVVKAPGLVLLHLAMNTQSPKLKDPRVRLAIEHGIDKSVYNQVVYGGNATTPRGPLPDASLYLPEKAEAWPYDPEKARRLLKDAGVKDLELNLWVMNASDRINGATVLQSMLAQIGIKVNVTVYENAVINDRVRKGDHDLYLSTWGMQNSRDAGMFWQAQFTKSSIGATNDSWLSDDRTDDWINEANHTIDGIQRNAIFDKIWDRINELHPWVYMSLAEELNGSHRDLLGVEDLLDGKINFLGNLHYPEQPRLQ